jgi:hypothetical protein
MASFLESLHLFTIGLRGIKLASGRECSFLGERAVCPSELIAGLLLFPAENSSQNKPLAAGACPEPAED